MGHTQVFSAVRNAVGCYQLKIAFQRRSAQQCAQLASARGEAVHELKHHELENVGQELRLADGGKKVELSIVQFQLEQRALGTFTRGQLRAPQTQQRTGLVDTEVLGTGNERDVEFERIDAAMAVRRSAREARFLTRRGRVRGLRLRRLPWA